MRVMLLFMFFVFSKLSAQDSISKTSIFIDSLNLDTWGDEIDYIENMEKLSMIALKEDNFAIYEQCRSSIYIVYNELDDDIGLENALRESFFFVKDTLNSSAEFRAEMLDWKATLYKKTGDFKGVVDMRYEAIDELNKKGNLSVDIIRYYANLAIDLKLLGDFVKSREYSIKSLDILNGRKKSFYLKAYFWLNLGKLDAIDGNYLSAISNFKKTLCFLELESLESVKKNRLLISCRQFLAEAYIKLEDFFNAKLIIDEVEELQKEFMYREYRTYEILGNYYSSIGNVESSIYYAREALFSLSHKKIRTSEVAVNPRLCFNLAKFHEDCSNTNEALLILQEGLCHFVDSLNLSISYNPSLNDMKNSDIALRLMLLKIELLIKKSENSQLVEDFELCKSAFTATLELLGKMRTNFLNNESKFYVLDKAIPVYNSYLDLVFEYYERIEEESDKEVIFDIIGQTKSAILSDKLNYKNLINDPNLPPFLIEKEKDLRLKRALYKKQVKKMESQDSIDVEQLAAFKDSLFSFNQDYDILDKRIREAKEEVAGWNLNDDMELDEFSALLPKDEMVIDYYTSDEYIYSVALLNGEISVDRIELSKVENDIKTYIDYISKPPSASNGMDASEVSQRITNALLKPYLGNKQSVKSLRILPSGILNALPFEALIYEENGNDKYLIEDCPIVYSVSRSQLLQKEALPSSYNIMALAPKFESEIIADTRYACDGAELSNLKYAQEEVGYIQDAYGVSNNDSISATYFLKNISNNDICHLATHGCVNASDPMLSEIFFNDQPVTGYDVMNLDTDISLMFLSACNTAKGEDIQGEGVIGLTSGFFEAGVRNMISSLWSIDDLASSQIVKGFYKNVKEGESYSQALRSSKLEYLESADKLRSHPYYWAGLVQIGAGVTVQKSTPWWIYLGGLGFLGLAYLFWSNSKK